MGQVYFSRKWDSHIGSGDKHEITLNYALDRKKKGKAVVMLAIEEIEIAKTSEFGECEVIEMMRRNGWVRS